MKPMGEDVAEAMREWMKSEIRDGTGRGRELGKFFFGVSTGMAGLIVTIVKLDEMSVHHGLLYISLGLFAVSAIIALHMAKPRIWHLGGESDLFEEYKAQVSAARTSMAYWSILWGAALLTGTYALFFFSPDPALQNTRPSQVDTHIEGQ